ncbi:MAG: hypothetical protein ACRDUB_18275, partial [Mycobacterium sp.]
MGVDREVRARAGGGDGAADFDRAGDVTDGQAACVERGGGGHVQGGVHEDIAERGGRASDANRATEEDHAVIGRGAEIEGRAGGAVHRAQEDDVADAVG